MKLKADPTMAAGLNPGSCHLDFTVDKMAPGQVFSEYFGFLCHFSFLLPLHIH
jgi:hypothetical protein